MREIRYRIWDRKEKVMLEIPQLEHQPLASLIDKAVTGLLKATEQHDRYVFLQYTGLKDCTGKEIYEGDIISATIPGYQSDITIAYGTVYYQGGSFRVPGAGGHPGDWVRLDSLAPTVKVVSLGNAFESLELLEA